jgi:hypothetical protein
MRELIVTENITLDGVIDASEGWFNPAGNDAAIDQQTLRRLFASSSTPMLCCSGG